jgi:MFS family permease
MSLLPAPLRIWQVPEGPAGHSPSSHFGRTTLSGPGKKAVAADAYQPWKCGLDRYDGEQMSSAATRATASSTTRSRGPANRWAVLTLLGVAQLMIVLDVTIVNIALPSAQQALHFSTDDRQWIITAYALTFGSLLLLGGKLGDLFGRKWTFVAGLLGFASASALGGLAPSFGVLVAARALQGSFGALLAPSALSLLTITFHDSPDRPKAFGIFSAIAASGTSVGLLLGGVLTQTLSWRWCLYVNLLFAIPAAIAAMRLIDGSGAQRPRPRIDGAGAVAASAGLFCLVYGFSSAETHAWSAGLTIAAFTASALLLASFVLIEHRARRPLLPLRIVADRSRGGAYASMAIVGAALFSVFLFMTFYMQQILRFSPVKTGLGFLPLTGAIIIVAPLVQTKILPRLGPRAVIVTGMILGITAMVIFTRLTPGGSYATHVLPGLIPAGAGAACVFSASFATGRASPRPRLGRPGCGRPRAALPGASAWRCRPPSSRIHEPGERARAAWARCPARIRSPRRVSGSRAAPVSTQRTCRLRPGRPLPCFPGTTPCRLHANLDEPAGVPCPARQPPAGASSRFNAA